MNKPEFSRIIAGCMSWGDWGKTLDQSEIISTLHHCVEHDITTFDHADIYGDYTTEAVFGKALFKSAIERESVQLISKCGIQYVGQTRANKIKHYDYSKSYIIWSVENSLKNLKTEYLDALLLHRPSPLMQPEEIAEAIIHLKNQGKIRHFGVSNFTSSQVELLNKVVSVEMNQIEYSLTHFDAHTNGVLDQMILQNIMPMAWSPLGVVFKEENVRSKRIKSVLAELSSKYSVTEDQLLLAWTLRHPSQIHPVIGTTNLKRIANATHAINISLDLEDWFKMLVASQGHKVP